MTPLPPAFSGELAHQCTQELYRCLEEVGSSKGALYLRVPKGQAGEGVFSLVCEYGWPRGSHAPEAIAPEDPLLLWVQREKRPFVVNEVGDFPELGPFSEGSEAPRFLLAPIYLKGDWVGLLVQRERIKGVLFDLNRDEKPTMRICNDIVEVLTGLNTYGEPAVAGRPRRTVAAVWGTMPMPLVSPRPRSGLLADVAGLAAGAALAKDPAEPGLTSKESFTQLPWDTDTRSGVQAKRDVAPVPATPTIPTLSRPETGDEPAVGGKRRGMALPEQRAFFWETARLLAQMMALDAVALWMDEPEEIRPILAYSDRPLSPDLQQQLLAHATFHLTGLKEEDLQILTRPEKREVSPLGGVFTTYLPLWLGEADSSRAGGQDLLLVFRLANSPFSESDEATIHQVGNLLHLHREEGRLHERYHRAFLSVSHRILKSGESRAPRMREHSLTCAKLSRGVALRLELPTADVEAISIAAILHDVGTLLLDPQMMKKPELSAAELAKARTHPMLAATFLKDLNFPFDVLRIIRHHHERWDGKGYPDGLAGEAIPIGSRIIGLIEAFDVMTTGKGYKAPKALANVLEEIRAGAGSQFDPKAVEALVALVGKGKAL